MPTRSQFGKQTIAGRRAYSARQRRQTHPRAHVARNFSAPMDNAQDSFTDTDSRMMKRRNGGYDFAYNVHTAIDNTLHIIIAAELTNNAADPEHLPVLLDAAKPI